MATSAQLRSQGTVRSDGDYGSVGREGNSLSKLMTMAAPSRGSNITKSSTCSEEDRIWISVWNLLSFNCCQLVLYCVSTEQKKTNISVCQMQLGG